MTPTETLLTVRHRVYARYDGATWRACVGVWTDNPDGADEYRDAKHQGVPGESADACIRNCLTTLNLTRALDLTHALQETRTAAAP